MSNPYPSRRELRLQRERAERAKLREAELKRWTDEVEQREQPSVDTSEPMPATDQGDEAEDAPEQPVNPEAETENGEPAEEDEAVESGSLRPRRYRRAVSPVTSTGMLPIISKPSEEPKEPKPQSRREARQREARRAAQRRAEIARLQREQDGEVEEAKPRRRATAPQTTPATVDVDAQTKPDTPQPSEELHDELADVEITSTHDLSATEITAMSGLDTIEIRRAELRAETERLTQEIIELGESNPNVIDPQLLRRQKELAEKSQELQELETAAIELVESDALEGPAEESEPSADDDADIEPSTEAIAVSPGPEDDETPAEAPADTASSVDSTEQGTAQEPSAETGRRGRRRTTQGPFVSGPFEITEDDESPEQTEPVPEKTKKPPLAEFIRAPVEPEPERDPREPLDASSAHGLDTLDARDVEAPDRRLRMSAVVMFAIGVLALIIAIILLVQ